MQKRRKSKTRVVNITFTYQFTWSCIFEGKCSIYYLCPWFHPLLHFFCTLLALSKFAENQIFRAVARAPTRTCHQVRFWFIIFFGLLQYCICLSLYWHMFILGTETSNQHAIISSHYTFRCWKVADIASYSLVLVQFPRFFYHHPSPLRVTLQRKLMKLRP